MSTSASKQVHNSLWSGSSGIICVPDVLIRRNNVSIPMPDHISLKIYFEGGQRRAETLDQFAQKCITLIHILSSSLMRGPATKVYMD
jgi:hypothetical protein